MKDVSRHPIVADSRTDVFKILIPAKETMAEPTALVLTGLSLLTSLKGTSLSGHNPRVLAAVTGKNVPWEH